MTTLFEYQSKHQELMQEWKQKYSLCGGYKYFVEDGIVNPEIWFSSPQKERIVFLLKEAYTKEAYPCREGTLDWNEASWLNGNPCRNNCPDKNYSIRCRIKGNSFNRIAEWTYYIRNHPNGASTVLPESIQQVYWLGENNSSRKKCDNLSAYCAVRNNLLKKIAIVNIKKIDGVSKSNSNDITKHAQKYASLLIRQIQLLAPAYVVCCGTYNLLSQEMQSYLTASQMRVIKLRHPNRISVKDSIVHLNNQLLYTNIPY